MTALRWSWRAVLAALCVPMLSACVVAPVGYYDSYGYGYYGYGYGSGAGETIAVADMAPPAPYYEVRPVMPYVGAVWIGGYWNWYGGRHVWVPGYWGAARPGYVWHPYRWAPYGGRWNLYGGGWARGR
jgi:hypothetical protein